MNRIFQNSFLSLLVLAVIFSTDASPQQVEREFAGTINKTIRIKMQLCKMRFQQSENEICGSYFYEKVGKEIVLNGTLNGQQITLREYDKNGKQTGTFKGRFVSADVIEGIWTNADGTKSYPFSVSATGSIVSTAPSSTSGIDGKYERVDAKGRLEKESGAQINVKMLANGMTQIEGEAVLVVDARRGNVRTGTVGGTFQLTGNKLLIKEGDDEYSCKMTIVFSAGKLEVTEDNGHCGGLGVSFIGDYKKTGTAKFQH
jgi:hypothetical protein